MNDAPYIDIKRFAVDDGPECSHALYGQKTVLPGGAGRDRQTVSLPLFCAAAGAVEHYCCLPSMAASRIPPANSRLG